MATPYENAFHSIDDREKFPDWMNRVRQAAYHSFLEHDFPTSKQESWKYINLRSVLTESFIPEPPLPATIDPEEYKGFFIEGANQIVFVNGQYSETLSNFNLVNKKVIFAPLTKAFEKHSELIQSCLPRNKEPFNAFSDINTFSFNEGVFLYVPDQVKLKNPVHILFITTEEAEKPFVYYPKIVAYIGKESYGNVFVQYLSKSPQKYFCNAVLDLSIDKKGKLEYARAYSGKKEGMHFDMTRVTLHEESRFQAVSLSEGGALSRHDLQVDFKGEGAEALLNGLCLIGKQTEIYNHVTVNHHVPNCKSDQLYKNILTEQARTEFNGLVYVHRDAQQSDSAQLNKNLLLSDAAKAYSRPQLKIYADDVKCTHGSATGQLEGEEVFYLNSRGLNRDTANHVLTHGFAEEVIERIPNEEIRKRLEAIMVHELMKIKYENASDN